MTLGIVNTRQFNTLEIKVQMMQVDETLVGAIKSGFVIASSKQFSEMFGMPILHSRNGTADVRIEKFLIWDRKTFASLIALD